MDIANVAEFLTFFDWKGVLLQTRDLERPDGRPLYKYRINESEFHSLEDFLRKKIEELHVLNDIAESVKDQMCLVQPILSGDSHVRYAFTEFERMMIGALKERWLAVTNELLPVVSLCLLLDHRQNLPVSIDSQDSPILYYYS